MKRTIYGVVAAAVLLAAGLTAITCKKSSNPTAPPGPAANVVIQITGINGSSSFSPNPATVKVGQTVAWHNQDATNMHSATPNTGGFTSMDVGAGATSAAQTITAAAADYGYHCRFHLSMVGPLHVIP